MTKDLQKCFCDLSRHFSYVSEELLARKSRKVNSWSNHNFCSLHYMVTFDLGSFCKRKEALRWETFSQAPLRVVHSLATCVAKYLTREVERFVSHNTMFQKLIFHIYWNGPSLKLQVFPEQKIFQGIKKIAVQKKRLLTVEWNVKIQKL